MITSKVAEALHAPFRQCRPSSSFPLLIGLVCRMALLLFLVPGCGASDRAAHRPVQRRLVYIEANGASIAAKWRVMEMVADGSSHRVTAYGDYDPGVLRVSPDGGTVLLLASHGEALHFVSLTTGGVSNVRAPKGYFFRANIAWAPSGRLIACVAAPKGPDPTKGPSLNLLMLVNTETHVARILVGKTAALDGPTWSPDGHVIAFATSKGIEIVHADGTSRRRLVAATLEAGRGETPSLPAWAPNGRAVAFVYVGFPNGKTTVATVAIKHKSQRRLDSCDFAIPMWSPDGRYLLYGDTDLQGARRLACMELMSGKRIDLSSKSSSLFALSWSDDGKSILALRAPPSRFRSGARLVVISLPSRRETALDTGRGSVGVGAWLR